MLGDDYSAGTGKVFTKAVGSGVGFETRDVRQSRYEDVAATHFSSLGSAVTTHFSPPQECCRHSSHQHSTAVDLKPGREVSLAVITFSFR